jgi:tetratricopeptide (TPR) repeat protein
MKLTLSARACRGVAGLAFAAVLVSLLAIAWWIYHPGLSGDFLFDDFANLPGIGATGPVDNWATFWRYITSGTADPTGRPLTLLTFLIDARNWPASPYPFKVTNLILHLINGALLAWVLWKLGRALNFGPCTRQFAAARFASEGDDQISPSAEHAGRTEPARSAREHALFAFDGRGVAIAALFGAGAWLLHPLLVSTTLYIVQREAMLPATFVLIGLLGWMASREALARGHLKRTLTGMALSAWGGTLLAVLCKANGALFPLLLLLTEWIVLSRKPMPSGRAQRWYRYAVAVFLVLPSVLVCAYLLYLLPHSFSTPVETRGWSIGQRLLTESHVLTDYLRLLYIPQAHSRGLFNDAFPISTGWRHPVTTIPCVVLILSLIAAGFILRKKYPAVALALLFYFTAQLMESSWIPLEIYYEHRNYLPAMLLFWPIGLALGKPGALRFLRASAAGAIVVLLAALTAQRATLWGEGFRQAQVWAAINPDSARAQTNAALYDMQHSRPRLAAARLRLSLPHHPNDIQIPINLIGAECALGRVRPQTLAAANAALAHTRAGGKTAFKWFSQALHLASAQACTGLNFAALQATLDSARRNPHWHKVSGRQQDLDHLQGQLDLAEGRADAALRSFNRALSAAANPGTALEQAAYLGSHGHPKLGIEHLDYFATLPPGPKPDIGMPRIHAWVLRKHGWWPEETTYLRKNLEEDAASKATAGSNR